MEKIAKGSRDAGVEKTATIDSLALPNREGDQASDPKKSDPRRAEESWQERLRRHAREFSRERDITDPKNVSDLQLVALILHDEHEAEG
jgi:hypothetical protein